MLRFGQELLSMQRIDNDTSAHDIPPSTGPAILHSPNPIILPATPSCASYLTMGELLLLSRQQKAAASRNRAVRRLAPCSGPSSCHTGTRRDNSPVANSAYMRKQDAAGQLTPALQHSPLGTNREEGAPGCLKRSQHWGLGFWPAASLSPGHRIARQAVILHFCHSTPDVCYTKHPSVTRSRC